MKFEMKVNWVCLDMIGPILIDSMKRFDWTRKGGLFVSVYDKPSVNKPIKMVGMLVVLLMLSSFAVAGGEEVTFTNT